jgi:site-specific DNA-cytosine methylase
MKILIACEFSGIVRDAFLSKGHNAWSCDLLPSEREGKHIQDDVLKYLDDGWDLAIFFPPCTHLSKAGAHLWKQKQKDGRQQEAFEFIKKLWSAPIEMIALENPIGWLNTNWKKPMQIIEPYQFGDAFKRATCLWLRNLPKLLPTNIVEPKQYWVNASSNYRKTAKIPNKGLHRNPQDRSRTFKGIADAMAQQWGKSK